MGCHHLQWRRHGIHEHLDAGRVETSWTDAGPIPGDPDWAGGRAYTDRWSIAVRGTPEEVFAAVCRIGGGHGYYAADRLWRLRGWLDRMVGGPGLRRGRRDPERVADEMAELYHERGIRQFVFHDDNLCRCRNWCSCRHCRRQTLLSR